MNSGYADNDSGYTGQQEKKNYAQIDTIRFITISIIVWSHSLFPEWHLRVPSTLPESIIKTVVIQAGAISTVIFFIVSGILIRPKLHRYTLKKYFTERIPRIYAPWLFIVCFNFLLILFHQMSVKQFRNTESLLTLDTGYEIISGLLIYGPYWFVITYLAGMMVMVLFKRYVQNLFFGLALLCITALYSINFHFGWVDTFHTKAIFSYTFFIWLGFQIEGYWQQLLIKVRRAKWPLIITGLIITFSIAGYEGYQLYQKGVIDAFGSNRFTNIIFSLLFFFSLIKIGAIKQINSLQPRRLVYGIYLVNSIVILELSVLFNTQLNQLKDMNILNLAVLQLLYFAVVLSLTYVLVRYLAGSRLKWIIGA